MNEPASDRELDIARVDSLVLNMTERGSYTDESWERLKARLGPDDSREAEADLSPQPADPANTKQGREGLDIGSLEIPAPSHILSIHNLAGEGEELVTIELDGSVTFGPAYEPDEAARIFWDSLSVYFTQHFVPVAELTPEQIAARAAHGS